MELASYLKVTRVGLAASQVVRLLVRSRPPPAMKLRLLQAGKLKKMSCRDIGCQPCHWAEQSVAEATSSP